MYRKRDDKNSAPKYTGSTQQKPKASPQRKYTGIISLPFKQYSFFFVKLGIHNIYPYVSSWGESGVRLSRSLFIYVYIIVNREMIIQSTNKKPILEYFQISTLFPFLFFSELH